MAVENTSPFLTLWDVLPSKKGQSFGLQSPDLKTWATNLKDWPHLRVVLMQSSLKLKGSFRHSDKAPADIFETQKTVIRDCGVAVSMFAFLPIS